MRQNKSRKGGLEERKQSDKKEPIHGEPDSGILKEADAGMKVAEVCRAHGISVLTYYNWKSKYGGLEVSELRRIKELEAEHGKLKRMYADLPIENQALKDLIEKKL